MAGVRGESRNLKVDLKSNAREVVAWSREMGKLTPDALTTSVVNIMLAGMTQVSQSGIVRGFENDPPKGGTWFSRPVPGADHKPSKATAFDVREGQATYTYIRNEKGHIKDRKITRKETSSYYLFRDKWVSRTGQLDDWFLFDWGQTSLDRQWTNGSGGTGLQHLDGIHGVVFLEAYDGMKIAGRDGVALFQTTPDDKGEKVAFLERSRANNGELQPRYVIRRGVQSVSRRWSTSFRSEMKRAEKLAAKAAKAASRGTQQ